MNTPAPIAFDQVPPEWWHAVREIVLREGRPLRGNPDTLMIEIKDIEKNTWGNLMLPTNAMAFVDFESLRKATRILWGMDPLPELP